MEGEWKRVGERGVRANEKVKFHHIVGALNDA